MSGNPDFNIFIKELRDKRKKERLANIRGQNSLLFLKKEKTQSKYKTFSPTVFSLRLNVKVYVIL